MSFMEDNTGTIDRNPDPPTAPVAPSGLGRNAYRPFFPVKGIIPNKIIRVFTNHRLNSRK